MICGMNTKHSQSKKILQHLGVAGGIAVLSLVNPLLPYALLKRYLRKKRFQRHKFLQDIRRLQHRQLIDMDVAIDGMVHMRLRAKGKEVVLKYNIEHLSIEMPKRWDGVWRLVMFDIPSSKNKARDALRMKLKELGFYQLQKSVFLFPFACEKEIDALGVFWNVRDHIVLMRVSGFEGEEKLKHHFKI